MSTGPQCIASFTGPAATTFSGTIDWGDNSALSPFTFADVIPVDGGYNVAASHTYGEKGQYQVTVTINDTLGDTVTDANTMVSVSDATLANVTSVTAYDATARIGTGRQVLAVFTDANVLAMSADFSGMIDWGDNSGVELFTSADVSYANGVFTVLGDHNYATQGHYTVNVSVQDAGGMAVTNGGAVQFNVVPLVAIRPQ